MSKIYLLCVAAAAFARLVVADASPKALALDFKKEASGGSATAGRLIRRQKTLKVDITNEEILYFINVTIGTPPQSFSLQLDTGSSDIWIPAITADVCVQTPERCSFGAFDPNLSSSAKLIGQGAFSISYQDSSAVDGDFFSDTLNIGKQTIKRMQMGLATTASRGIGIMGIGFSSGESVIPRNPEEEYPNIINELKSQQFIKTLAYSLWLNDLDSNTGSILFGGVDTEKYHGDLTVLPIQPDSESGNITSFTVALESVSLVNKQGKSQYSKNGLALPVILDSGTTDTYLPDNIANAIISGVGAVSDPTFGYVIPCNLKNNGAKLSFAFGGSKGPSIEVDISEFVTDLTSDGEDAPTFPDRTSACSWGLLPAGDAPLLFGDTFLRSAYVVYNLENEQIGIAQTNFNATKDNIVEFSGTDIPGASATATGVVVTQTFSGHPLATDAQPNNPGATKISHGHPTPTFDLGKTSGAGGVKAPLLGAAGLVSAAMVALSCVLGGGMVFMM